VKAVFDTNVLIAAFVTEGICSRLIARARTGQFEFITCPFILKEFERTLREKILSTKEEVQDALMLISEAAKDVVHPAQKVTGVCRDAADDNILACICTAQADYLITGDSDLLELKTIFYPSPRKLIHKFQPVHSGIATS